MIYSNQVSEFERVQVQSVVSEEVGQAFQGYSSSAAEQVFSWFRSYARTLNETTLLRHAFKVLYFCKSGLGLFGKLGNWEICTSSHFPISQFPK